VPVARLCSGGRRRLVGKSRKHDSSHGFDLALAWEKESEEGNASKGLRRGTGGPGRWTAARRDRGAPVSNRARGKTGNRGEKGRRR
jgi:hypothetical protein